MKQVNRIEYIDIFRSFGIILMIMGHIGYGDTFDFFIHAFHMPMFFWVSGFLFKHKLKTELSFHTWFLKKTKALLLPYFIFGIAHYILYLCIKHNGINIYPLYHLFSTNTEGLPICGALWFLTALFFTDILFFIIDRYISCEVLKAVIITVIAFVGNLTKIIFPFILPFALGPAFVGLGLYYIGYLCRKQANNNVFRYLFNLSWMPNILLGIITTVFIFFNGYINMRTETYAIVPLFWINTVLSIIVGINFSKLIYKCIKNSIVEKWLVSIGRESIVYVCLNQVVILFVKKAIQLLNMSVYSSSILAFIITMVILWIISKIILNTKLKLLVGK